MPFKGVRSAHAEMEFAAYCEPRHRNHQIMSCPRVNEHGAMLLYETHRLYSFETA